MDKWNQLPESDKGICPDCDHKVWYCHKDERWYHLDPKKDCFLAEGKELK